MSKLKKLLVGFLALVLTVTMMPVQATMTAYATQRTTTDATIDTSKKGSLTIHKYEYNGSQKPEGTGEADDSLPTDEAVNPLAGAEFTIYKVVDLDGLDAYYSGTATELPDVSTYLTDGAISSSYADTKVTSIITDDEGIAKFENLDLGFYVVIETKTPASVTTPADPFLVSIPMTTTDGSEWLYDVHVYPKNKTTYGSVELKKTDEDGNVLKGVTFVLQKLDTEDSDEDNSTTDWINIYKKAGAAGDNTGAYLTLTTDDDGIIFVSGLTQGKYRFIETDRGNNDGYIVDGATTYNFVIGADGKVTYEGNTDNNITITVKNEKPDLDKEVEDRKDKSWGQDSDYSVGDTISYRITIDVPSNITKLKEFSVTDTPTNLKDAVDTIELVYGDTADAATNDVPEKAYSVATNGDGFTITFTPAEMAALAGKTIVITYDAKLLDRAVVTTAGNPNTAKLEYSNKIVPENDPDNPNIDDEPGKDVIEDTAIVYSFKLQILKTAETANGKALSGVKFDLYKEDTNGTIIGDDAKAIGLDSSKNWLRIATDLTTDTNGTVSQSGLSNGTYYLVETETVKEYNLLKAPVAVTLNIEYITKYKTDEYTDEDGVTTLVKHVVDTQTFKSDDTQIGDGTITQNIINNKGFTLPTTGGMGTVIFVIVGVSMMLAAVLLLLMSKKKEAK